MHSGLLQSLKDPHESQTGLPHCHSQKPLQKGQSNPEWSLHPQMFNLIYKVWHKPTGDMFATKTIPKLPLYVSPVPDTNALNIDALNISWVDLDGDVFCSVALIPNVIQNINTYRCKMIVVARDCPRMQKLNKSSITTTSLASSFETTVQSKILSKSLVSEPSCLAPRHHSESFESFCRQVAERIKVPQRSSSRNLWVNVDHFRTLVPTESGGQVRAYYLKYSLIFESLIHFQNFETSYYCWL